MSSVTIPKPVIWTVGDVLGQWYYSHTKLNTLFGQAGAPGDPPPGNCVQKCQAWLFRVNESLQPPPLHFLGAVLSEFMSLDRYGDPTWTSGRDRITKSLESSGLEYKLDSGVVEQRGAPPTDPIQQKSKMDQQSTEIQEIPDFSRMRFRVALSFPGEKRQYVEEVAKELRKQLPPDSVFYDEWYQHELARPNLDLLLQDVYRNRSDLVVIFLCRDYERKDWCGGVEWRAIRDLLKARNDDGIMFVRFDDAPIPGSFSTDGYIDARRTSGIDTANLIGKRIKAPTADLRVVKPLTHDKSDASRLVCALPRGVLVVEHLEPESNHLVASYFDYVQGWRRGTHYHVSYRYTWERDGAIDKQCFKVGIPESDWTYAKWAFLFLMEVREAESMEQVQALVDEWARDDRPMRLFQRGESIDLSWFTDAYPELKQTHLLRDLLNDTDRLLDEPNYTLECSDAHEEIFSLRLRMLTELANQFSATHPTYLFITQLLDQYGQKKGDHELRQWLQVVKRAIIEVIGIKRHENMTKLNSP